MLAMGEILKVIPVHCTGLPEPYAGGQEHFAIAVLCVCWKACMKMYAYRFSLVVASGQGEAT